MFSIYSISKYIFVYFDKGAEINIEWILCVGILGKAFQFGSDLIQQIIWGLSGLFDRLFEFKSLAMSKLSQGLLSTIFFGKKP